MDFIKPSEGRITSSFGSDILNGQVRQHFGVDFAQKGNVPIHASEGGIVSLSYLSKSYGECVRIVHKIKGKTYETLYAHMQTGSRKVKTGDKVKQGQLLGYMGNTGYSFGQHLHFELHEGTWNSIKSCAVDPLKYLSIEKESDSADGKLTRGEKGSNVKLLNQMLHTLEYTRKTDDLFDQYTEAALKAFQKDHGLVEDAVYTTEIGKVMVEAIKKKDLLKQSDLPEKSSDKYRLAKLIDTGNKKLIDDLLKDGYKVLEVPE
jgi:hypothetical protein